MCRNFYLRLFLISLLASLAVAEPPEITQGPRPQSKYVGQSASFSCSATGADSYQWLKGGRVPSTTRWKPTDGSLLYKDLKKDDDGIIITCRAINSDGHSDAETTLHVSEPTSSPPGPSLDLPQKPVDPSARAISSTSVEVSWRENDVGPDGPDSYTIEYRKANDSDWQRKDGITFDSWTVDSLMPNREYEFRVFGVNAAGGGEKTMPVTATTREDVPSGPPTNVVATPLSARQLNISWQLPGEDERNGVITKYRVSYGSSMVKDTTGTERHMLLGETDKIKPYTSYNVTVAAFTTVGQGPFSDSVVVIKTPQAAPDGPPQSVTASAEGTGIRVSWKAPDGNLNGELVGYNVSYSSGALSYHSRVEQNTLSVLLTDNVMAHTDYTIKVQALTDKDNEFAGPASEAVSVKTKEQPPSGAPGNFRVTMVTHDSITVQWDSLSADQHNGNLTSYELWYYPVKNPSDNRTVSVKYGDTTQSMLSNLKAFTEYVVAVVAKNGAGTGPIATLKRRTDETVPGKAPTDVKVLITGPRSMEVSWTPLASDDKNGDNVEYVVEYSPSGSGSKSLQHVVDGKSDKRFTEEIGGLSPNTNYSVFVYAQNEKGRGPDSDVVETKTLEDVPGAPRLHLRVRHHKQLVAEWDPPVEPNGLISMYSLWYEDLLDGSTEKNDNILPGDQPYDIGPLIGNRSYYVSLRARTTAGWGDWANQTGMTPEGPPDGPPRNVHVTAKTNSSLLVEWDEVERNKQHGIIRKYHINVSSSEHRMTHHRNAAPGSSHKFNIPDLQPYTEYSISVTAVTIGTGPYSRDITERTAEGYPSEVLDVKFVEQTNTTVSLIWREPAQKNGMIQKYVVMYRVKGETEELSKETKNRHLLIDGLEPYTEYEMWVVAHNSLPGLSSGISNPKTLEGYPDAPQSVEFQSDGNQYYAIISWKEPENPHGRLVGYTVTFKSQHATVDGEKYPQKGSIHLDDRKREHVFKKMQPNMEYEFAVAAHTSFGKGIKKSSFGKMPPSVPTETPAPKIADDDTLKPYQRKLNLFEADKTFGSIQYYRLGVFYSPIESISRRSDWPSYTAAHFAHDRLPSVFILGDNTTTVNRFRNKPLEVGMMYRLVFYAHINDDVIGESEATEFMIEPPVSPPKSDGGFPLWIIAVIVVIVVLIVIGLVVFIVIWRKRRETVEVRSKAPAQEEIDFGDLDAGDSIEYLRRQTHTTMDKYPSVKIADFEMHIKRLQANGNLKFTQEYESIKLDMDFTASASNLAVNDDKNRYSNIVAYDHSRVRLSAVKGQQGSDYINANYIDGHKKKNAYIATQGPLKETAGDFWRMVWEQRTSTIVMLTNLEERGRPKCYKYWPDSGSVVFDIMEVTLKEVITLADYVVRTFAIAKTEHPDEMREVKQLQFMSWPDHGVPTYATAMLAFQRKAKAADPPDAGPMILHCSAGVGRTGAFIVIDAMLDRVRETDSLDVYGHVTVLRSQRNYMVQTEDQYFFIHEAVLEAIQCGDTEINAKDLPTAMQRLNEVVADDGSTAIELEFKRLAMDKLDPSRFATANRPVNKNKNRFVNILPFENTRAVLNYIRGVDGSDYINASLVDGYKQRNAFIATQGPLKETEQDFWRMLWEQESKIVVMLTKLSERGQEKCHQYWPEGKAARYGPYVVDPLSEQRKADCILRQFKATNANDGSSRTLCQFQYVGWPENRSPVSGRALIDLIGEVQKLQEKTRDRGPVTVHCSAGVGRTGCFVALSIVLERMRCEGVLDIFQTVKMLRIQRPAMVQTLDQYQFVYDTALEYLDSFDHYADYAPLDVQEEDEQKEDEHEDDKHEDDKHEDDEHEEVNQEVE